MTSCAFGMFCSIVDRGHDHVVTAVHDECWLLDRLQIAVGPVLLDAHLSIASIWAGETLSNNAI
jgi:hypothetical protein